MIRINLPTYSFILKCVENSLRQNGCFRRISPTEMKVKRMKNDVIGVCFKYQGQGAY